MKGFAMGCVSAALLVGVGPASAQSEDANAHVPAVFSALDGTWSGTGTLMGRPASRWSGRFWMVASSS